MAPETAQQTTETAEKRRKSTFLDTLGMIALEGSAPYRVLLDFSR